MWNEYFNIDDITIIMSAILIVSAFFTPYLNGFFRKPKNIETANSEQDDESLPPLSIVLTPHNCAHELECNLPNFLGQDYPAGFEVIVVGKQGDSETDDVLKRFASDKHLYTTYTPVSSRYMSREKLAVTLGIKAAKNEWIVLSDVRCKPASEQWLRLMASHCADDKDMVIGYTAYDEETPDYRRFERLHTAIYLLREDRKGTPYRHNGNNLMLRKSMFIEGDGYRGNLKYLRGEYDFLVNKYATKVNTSLALDRDSWMIEQSPTDKSWLNKHQFYLENRQHMERSFVHRFLYNVDQWALHLNYLLIIGLLTYSILTQHWIIMAAAILALLLTVILRTVIARKAILQFDEKISSWKVIPYEVCILWHMIGYKISYRKADKYDFISHKL